MKKKLEAELISIAHRILKLKNRSELEQLQEETLRLYEKLSVLKFVEDNFNDVKPTIGYASAEAKLEEIYGVEQAPKAETEGEPENKTAEKTEAPVKEEEKVQQQEAKAEETQPQETEPEKEEVQEEINTADEADEKPAFDSGVEDEKEQQEEETQNEDAAKPEFDSGVADEKEEEPAKEPEHKIELEKPVDDVKAEEEAVKEVYEKEQDSAPEIEEKAEDAEIKTIAADKGTETEKSDVGFEFAFERKPAPETPVKQKEISFEDFHDYKEPEFVRKDDVKAETPVPAETKTEEDDWQNWEPKKDEPAKEEPRQEALKEELKPEPAIQEAPKQAAPQPAATAGQRSLNDAFGKTINLGLNDRIAFEKHLFGGSGEDLNRVLSQLNTFDKFSDARDFINDLVKPDYNNWKDKEEYEERFMALVEKKFD
ncbi:hypothetical protein [Flavobacterium sp.]|uniref:hypothetical protein n=1 Tax=Flavobacterium sp. TaxID=239 RepID=UPI002608F5E7|nr:hypothetical protein [Flavobacterium sp.]